MKLRDYTTVYEQREDGHLIHLGTMTSLYYYLTEKLKKNLRLTAGIRARL